MRNYFKYTFLAIIFFSCSQQRQEPIPLKGIELLNKSISVHDPNGKWEDLELAIHVQEPRTGNPSRYSQLKLNNANGVFELIRNREKHLSKHIVDENNQSKVFLGESEEIVDSLVEKFRLKPERNEGYRDFYQMMYGLPMTLNTGRVEKIGDVTTQNYNQQICYRIPIELKEEMFSKNWIVYIAKDSYEFKGMEIVFPNDKTKGERLYFEGNISIDGVNIPRIRHWHEYSNNEYSGSDIILKELIHITP